MYVASTQQGTFPERVTSPPQKYNTSKTTTGSNSNNLGSTSMVAEVFEAGARTTQFSTQPLSMRAPAQVMRIWIAPLEDKQGDLMVSGYIYTEIEPRRWGIANRMFNHEPVLRPLQAVALQPLSEIGTTHETKHDH